MLKLVSTTFNYRVHVPPFFFQMIILSMHLLSRMDVMLDFICMWSVDLRGARGKRNNTTWIILDHNGAHTRSSIVVFCILKTNKYFNVFLLQIYLSNIDVFQYVTQCSTCTRQNTIHSIVHPAYTNEEEIYMYVCTCIKVTLKGELSLIPARTVGRDSDYEFHVCEF